MRLVQSIRTLAAVALLAARPAAAQPVASTEPRAASPGEPAAAPRRAQPAAAGQHSARSVAGAPRADQASGIARPEPAPDGRKLTRALLFLPRVAFWVANAPLRAGTWASERYQVPLRVREALFNDEGTAGVVPIARAESGVGAAGGARFLHRDLLGHGEHLVAAAEWGGRRAPGASLWIDSGERLGDRLLLRVDAIAEERPRDRFFGIGNGDQVAAVAAPVDPYADPAAVDTRFHQRRAAVTGSGALRLVGPLDLRLSSSAIWRRVDADSDRSDIDDSYLASALPGFGDDRAATYSELALAVDTRDRPARSEPPGPRATGIALSLFAGAASGPAYGRAGGEARAQLPLGSRRRLLVLRALGEGVSGPLDEIPFVDLPRLGGPLLLRGYPADRFRDRAMGLASAEYRFDLGDTLGGFLFADAGRVGRDLPELAGGDLRAGYGGGLDVRRGELLLGRLTIASSIDGGLFVSAAFDPLGSPEGDQP